MSAYTPTIGLEIHAELNTATKMFCRSKNDPDEEAANQNICPVCMAHPGTLPVINKEAVKSVLRVGTALGSTLADYTEFDRKNYFYPDLPKGYQLSQYEFPLVEGGTLNGVELTRIHLEEDTASSVHDPVTDATVIDYNRAGVPLMELVTEPVVHSAEDATQFARELQLLLRYLGVSHANMEKGEMRVEANISISNTAELGTKVEVKNLNSFRAVEKAIEFEIKRQAEILEKGGEVDQETRGWDENKQITFAQRVKEGSADYRYFPDPDLPKLQISEIEGFDSKSLTETLPELPWERRKRYAEMGVKEGDIDIYVREIELANFFDVVTAELGNSDKMLSLASNYITTDLTKLLRDAEDRDTDFKGISVISAKYFAELIDLIDKGELSSRGAKDILAIMIGDSRSPSEIAEEKGLFQSSNADDLIPIVQDILAEHVGVVEEYKAGKEASLQFLVGQGMKATKGSANPQMLRDLLVSEISK